MVNKGFLYALSTAIMFATMGIFTKLIYRFDGVNANALCFATSLISCIYFFVLALIKHKNFSFLKMDKYNLILSTVSAGIFGLFLINIPVLSALSYVDVGIQKILTYSFPLFIILINTIIFKKKLTGKSILVALLVIAGLILVIGKFKLDGSNLAIGVMWAILSAISWAIYNILCEKYTIKMEQSSYWFYGFFSFTIYTFIYMLIIGDVSSINNMFILDFKFITLLLCISLINLAIPNITLYKSHNF